MIAFDVQCAVRTAFGLHTSPGVLVFHNKTGTTKKIIKDYYCGSFLFLVQ